jgi:3-methyladenine DNA glycosylase/8-oxoguanine DNA glycosylase
LAGLELALRPRGPLDLRLTLGRLPGVRLAADGAWRSTRTPAGPASQRLRLAGGELRVEAFGPGAGWLLEHAGELVGEDDRPEEFRPTQPLLRDLRRRYEGLRFARTRAVFEALLPAVLEQKVQGVEARLAYRRMVAELGEPAPHPEAPRLPPSPALLARLPYFRLHPFGVERRRAETLIRAAAAAARLEAGAPLQAIAGVGPWTEAEVRATAGGDADAVSVGDYHLPHMVSWALAGRRRGSDEEMLELLEPYRPHRGRVLRLLELAGVGPPRRGPRLPLRRLAQI